MASRSTAVWCALRAAPQDIASAEIHFNYWRLAGDRGSAPATTEKRDFAEIGVFLENPGNIEKICIYIPEDISPAAIEDCGPYFSQVAIAQGIFNENISCNIQGPPNRIELSIDGSHFCRVHRFILNQNNFIENSQLEAVSFSSGTLLTITQAAINDVCDGLENGGRAYFRLRVFLSDGENASFVRKIKRHDRHFQSSYDELEYIDFRINESRTLPELVEQRMRVDQGVGRVRLTLVAFLAAVPVLADLVSSSRPPHKNRLLEHQLWNSYVQAGIPAGMVVYHWKKHDPNGINDFSSFIKLQTRRSSKRLLTIYLIVAFVFALAGNLVASCIKDSLASPANQQNLPGELEGDVAGDGAGVTTPKEPQT